MRNPGKGVWLTGKAAIPVGAGLLAKRAGQSTSLLIDTPLSRASPLPHFLCRAVEELLGVVASHLAVIERAQGWLFGAAALGGVRAALVESAA